MVIICSRLNFYETIKREVNKRLTHMSVGVMKDEKLNLRVLHVSDTLKVYYESKKRDLKTRPIYECFVYYDSRR